MAITVDVGKIKLVWRGTYAGATAYEVDDLVLYDDGSTISSYICVADSTGNVPSTSGTVDTDYWNLAAKGSSASAGGTGDNQIQLKSGTGFAGDALFVFDPSTNRLGVNTSGPTSTLDVDGLLDTTDLTVENHFNATGISTFSDTLNVSEGFETATITAGAANATANLDIKTSSVWVFTTNSGATWTHNIRGDGSTTLNSMMATGQSLVVTVLSAQNNASYYSQHITIDGSAVTENWINPGTAPSSGASSGYDVYTWTIIKTGSDAYVITAAKTSFG